MIRGIKLLKEVNQLFRTISLHPKKSTSHFDARLQNDAFLFEKNYVKSIRNEGKFVFVQHQQFYSQNLSQMDPQSIRAISQMQTTIRDRQLHDMEERIWYTVYKQKNNKNLLIKRLYVLSTYHYFLEALEDGEDLLGDFFFLLSVFLVLPSSTLESKYQSAPITAPPNTIIQPYLAEDGISEAERPKNFISNPSSPAPSSF